MHLRLAFLGEIADVRAAPLAEALSGSLSARPFAVAFRGFGVFPPHGAAHVLWLGVGAGRDEIIDVQRRVTMRLGEVGIEGERRPFHPHLTLARWRGPGAPQRAHDAVRRLAAATAVTTGGLVVDHVTLYQSRLSPAGPTYLSLARATLT
jgi:2'-5' RNA ligase